MNNLITQIEIIIKQYGTVGVFLAGLFEEIVAPIPSTIVSIIAGFFILPIDGKFFEILLKAIPAVAIPISLGITLGSFLVFLLAYLGGKPVINKWGRWFGLKWSSVEKFENKMKKGYADEIILLIARITPFMPSVVISAFCGIIRYPLWKFVWITLLGTFIRSLGLAMIGWKMREAYVNFVNSVNIIENVILILLALLVIIYLIYSWRKKRI